ncbi:MAG: hypothetical protein AAB778_01120 [Patescibacteria group bacterium]
MFKLNTKQINKISNLFMDLGKALLLSGLLIKIVDNAVTTFETIRSILGGLFFAYISIKIIGERYDK